LSYNFVENINREKGEFWCEIAISRKLMS
jgi:hypothetical protein